MAFKKVADALLAKLAKTRPAVAGSSVPESDKSALVRSARAFYGPKR